MRKNKLLLGLLATATLASLSGCAFDSGKANESTEQSSETSKSADSSKADEKSSEKSKDTSESEKKNTSSEEQANGKARISVQNGADHSSSDDKIQLNGEKLPRQNGFPTPSGPATFTRSELTPSPKGWIQYGELSGGRATAANAVIVKSMIGTGTVADPSLKPAGFISGQPPYGHARGHLIGRQLGGSGRTLKNLVTLYQNPVNTPYMTKYENIVRTAAEEGEQVRYRVTPTYKRGREMPATIIMEARTINSDKLNFKVVIPNER